MRAERAGQRRKEVEARPVWQRPPPSPQAAHLAHVSLRPRHRPAVLSTALWPSPSPSLGNSQVTDSLGVNQFFPCVSERASCLSFVTGFRCSHGNYASGSSQYYLQLSNFFPLPPKCQMKVGKEPFSLSRSVNTPCSPPLLLKIPLLLPSHPICRRTLRRKQTFKRKASS